MKRDDTAQLCQPLMLLVVVILIVPRIKLKALPFATAWFFLAVDMAGWCDGQNGESPSLMKGV